jgi:demethylmenaquinone methyltransferase/2-methoxy-6-polyprenyl-1,4-benzoquinol methylase
MVTTDPAGTPRGPEPAAAYGRDAPRYDARTAGYDVYRRRAIDLLPLAAGDVVVDVGCGTGLCFERLIDRIGPGGTVIGVEPAAAMRALAEERAAARGWANVVLIGSPVEEADLPTVDHALFCAVHDVLQSPAALDHVLARVRDGGGVAATGGKWAPPWAVLVNAGVLAVHAPFVRDFAGFSRPWEPLAARVPGLSVEEVAWGGGYLAWGTVRHRPTRVPPL